MPIYEYECTDCGEVEEIIQKFSDKPFNECKRCSGKLHKLVSQSSFHLKGTGWYVTDYADKSQNHSTPQEKSAETSTTNTNKSKKVPEVKNDKVS